MVLSRVIIRLFSYLNVVRKAEYVVKLARPMPVSKILKFLNDVNNHDFNQVLTEPDPDRADIQLLDILLS